MLNIIVCVGFFNDDIHSVELQTDNMIFVRIQNANDENLVGFRFLSFIIIDNYRTTFEKKSAEDWFFLKKTMNLRKFQS